MRRALPLAAVGLLLAGCMMDVKLPPLTSASSSATATESGSAPALPAVTVRQSAGSENRGSAWADLSFPVFLPGPGDAVAAEIADQANASVAMRVQQFKGWAGEAEADGYVDSSLHIDLAATRLSPELMVFHFQSEMWVEPWMSWVNEGWTVAFRTDSGAEVSLLSELRPGARFEFEQLVASEVAGLDNADFLQYEDARASDEIYDNWLPTELAVRLTFNALDIASRSEGEQELWLAWEDLLPLLRPDSPLARFQR